MTSVLLALVLVLPSPTQMVAYQTWDRISWEYQLPPASITVDAPWMSAGALASYAGSDSQGRAVIGVRRAKPVALQNNVAHEAAHALMRPLGMTEEQEHVWADSFALCFGGLESGSYGMRTCADVEEFFTPFRR